MAGQPFQVPDAHGGWLRAVGIHIPKTKTLHYLSEGIFVSIRLMLHAEVRNGEKASLAKLASAQGHVRLGRVKEQSCSDATQHESFM